MSWPNMTDVRPKQGLPGLIENWRYDLRSGFLVFLIALPLCVGIAIASGFPAQAGIITAVIGGVLVSRISGSHLTVNGPAAGLIVVILDSVGALGNGDPAAGYRYTLAAIVCAAVIQVLLGAAKAGKLSAFFPAAAVHGMLAAIGITIAAKQIHVMLGVKPDGDTLFETIGAIPNSLIHMNPEIAAIGFLSLFLLIFMAKSKNKYVKMVPAPLIVVLLGIGLDKYFSLEVEHSYTLLPDIPFLPHREYTVGPKALVPVPENILASFTLPDFGLIGRFVFWQQVIIICLVGSLETLLSAAAVDKLDPFKRYSNLNRDLAAVGVGNFVAGMLGGLPMIAEIVRSSANVANGARTSWANFFHGAFLLTLVVLAPRIIHSIPLAALAALLVFTGYRLASPKEFKKTLEIGFEQLGVFIVTIASVLATDLLVGVAIGILSEFFIHLYRTVQWREVFKINLTVEEAEPGVHQVTVGGAAFFANYFTLKNDLSLIPEGKIVVFDLSKTTTIDHTVMEYLHNYCQDYTRKGGHADIRGLENHQATSDHPLSARRIINGKPNGFDNSTPPAATLRYPPPS